MLRHFFLLLIVIVTETTFAQPSNLPLDKSLIGRIEVPLNDKNANFHTALKPYLFSEVTKHFSDSLERLKLFILPNESSKKKIQITTMPLFSVAGGYETYGNKFPYQLMAGITSDVIIGQKLSSRINVYTSRESFASYIDSVVKYSQVSPGFGAVKRNEDGYYTYRLATGYLSYSPNKIFNFQAGVDKHFWGDGYRSLILSDAANPFPFLKISTTVWKLKYVSLFAAMKDFADLTDTKNKFGTFHYLSWNVSKRLNLSLFESVVWQGADTNRYRGYDINYLNPVLFFRPAEYSLGSSDNSLLGMGYKLILFKKHVWYGQIMLDEFLMKELKSRSGWWANKYALQTGYKIFDLIGVNGLFIQAEYNYVRPYTYSHGSVQQNYAHYNIPLAHPRGANFTETVGVVSYTKNKLTIEGKAVYVQYGADTGSVSYGGNIFISYKNRFSEYGNTVGQGLHTKTLYASLKGSYLIVPKSNMRVECGALIRNSTSIVSSNKTLFVFLGFSSAIGNWYNDYQ